ncbi:hydrogenase maturation peptidase HycI [Candidatus Margulisiibacteriota bacterium]
MVSDLRSKLKSLINGKVAVLGIGNTLKNDDGIGALIARSLNGRVNAKVIDCGETPENYTGVIRKEGPDTVLLIDAVDFKGEAGDIRLIENSKINNLGLTTHNMPLTLFIGLIENEIKAKVVILGVQPKSTAFGENISSELLSSKMKIENILIDILRG